MRKALPAVLVLLSLLAAATAPVPAAAATQDEGLAPDGVTVHIDIQGDGDARWTISTSYVLNNSSERDAFDRVAADFERGQGTLGFSMQAFERVVPEVAERTGRDMTIRDPQWRGVVENESGVPHGYLRLSFTWTNFAHVSNETVTLGGAFEGGWFGDLGPDQTLVITPPSGFDVTSAQPSHETVNGTLRWTGPTAFGPNEPIAQFNRQPIPPEIPWASIAGAVLTALVIGGIIAYAWLWRSSRDADGGSTPDEMPAETAGGGGSESTTGGSTASVSEPAAGENTTEAGTATGTGATAGSGSGTGTGTRTGTGAGTAAGAGAAGGAAGGATGGAAGGSDESESEPETDPEPELLSDEERVERLLEEHGGRMKQAKIVDETRWSNAKVSQLLSQMADDDRIEKLRIGRENLISIAEDESDDAGP